MGSYEGVFYRRCDEPEMIKVRRKSFNNFTIGALLRLEAKEDLQKLLLEL
ncbi:predicted protein [Sclerotinia sclerotiorum 1980 UF-70]|uniref:Uncharacterized protein n=1 Tax=Sclerotinia sclerotiorum (strain ATCC 18683 / 1980 / Ss-1) TaxID=665079 RepID=A7E7G7_SCLS1|nr:predicted protein [Sclerotinia sclerotiorum 1980 UF-70]EDN96319.1 predicted protein [Sclerotinia sclerotiorum 1980 UF-70]